MEDIKRYLEILGLKSGVSLDEVKEAYLDLVKVWHPDRFAHDPKLQQKAQEKLKEINEAYQKIQDFLNNYYKYQESFKSDAEQSTESERKNYSNSQSPHEPPPQSSASNVKPIRSSGFFSWIWPPIYDSKTARDAAKIGFYVAILSAIVTAIIAFSKNLLILVDASIFAVIAFGIFKMSRVASVTGLCFLSF